MTLFEVSISLVIVAFGIVSVLMIFPNGIKVQQLARYQVYASAKALEIMDSYNTSPTANPSLEVEAPNPWDVSASRCNMAFDLERRVASYRFGIIPLPLEIARRIDSDAGEIQQVLDDGGYLYYSQPQAATGFADTGLAAAPPNDAQRLVFAVTGYAQNNAVPIFPWKSWPYYMPFPSPPSHGTHGREPDFSEPMNAIETIGGKRGILWEDTFDPDMRPVFWCNVSGIEYGYRNHQSVHDLESAKRYCKVALWYCKRKGIDALTYGSITAMTGFPTGTAVADRWKLVQALRFLSHATTCLTAYVPKSGLEIAPGVTIDAGFDPNASGVVSDEFSVTLAKIQALHDSTMNLTALFAACHPYDWAVPRPLQRAIMVDHPLIEYDLFSAPFSGSLFGASGIAAQQWKPIPAQPIQHPGRSFQFSNIDLLGTSPTWTSAVGSTAMPNATNWGNPAHFTLTKPFSPDERCRQLVFWVVDWLSYCGGDPVNRTDTSGLDWEYSENGGGVVPHWYGDTTTPGGWRYKDGTPTNVAKPNDDVTPAMLGLTGNVFTNNDYSISLGVGNFTYFNSSDQIAYGPAGARQTLSLNPADRPDPALVMALAARGTLGAIDGTGHAIAEPYNQVQDITKVVGAKALGVPTQYLQLNSSMAAGGQMAVDQERVASFVTTQVAVNTLVIAGPPGLNALGNAIERASIARAESAMLQQAAARAAAGEFAQGAAMVPIGPSVGSVVPLGGRVRLSVLTDTATPRLTSTTPLYGPFHRDSPFLALSSLTLRGAPLRNIYSGGAPAAKAMDGTLGVGDTGFEFYTLHPPSNTVLPGGQYNWFAGSPGVTLRTIDGVDYAEIFIVPTRVVRPSFVPAR